MHHTLYKYISHSLGPELNMHLLCGRQYLNHYLTFSNLFKRISYPDLLYEEAPEISNLQYLSTRRDISCKKFVESLRRDVSPYNPLTKIMEIRLGVKTHDYDLRNDRTVE
jgi:hypothetical protein